MQIEEIQTDKLIPYEYNNKIHDAEQINRIANSIKEFGFLQPLVIDANNILIVGHGRLEGAKKLGLETVPCIRAENLSDVQIKKYRILDNKLNESEWDKENLKMELEELGDLNIGDIELSANDLFPDVKLNNMSVEDIVEDEEEVPEATEAVVVKRGDIFKLGRHRLMCGDSTSEEDTDLLYNGEVADLLFTDPPYNVNVSNSQGMTIENDNMENAAFRDFLSGAFRCASAGLKEGGAFYVRHADGETVNFRTQCDDNGLMVKQTLIRVKNSFNFGRQDYKRKHEPCLYGWKEGAGHYFVEEYNLPTVIEDQIDLDSMKKEDMKELLEEILSDKVATTVFHENKPVKNDLHPTMKPVKMCASLILHSSRENETVLDLFGGSGSTLIACEQINRRCVMMEYDPRYAEVIIKRFHAMNPDAEIKCVNREIDLSQIL